MIDNVIKQSKIITIQDIEHLQETYKTNKEIIDILELNKQTKMKQPKPKSSWWGGKTSRSYRKHTKRTQKRSRGLNV
jgi:hypothetical protein